MNYAAWTVVEPPADNTFAPGADVFLHTRGVSFGEMAHFTLLAVNAYGIVVRQWAPIDAEPTRRADGSFLQANWPARRAVGVRFIPWLVVESIEWVRFDATPARGGGDE